MIPIKPDDEYKRLKGLMAGSRGEGFVEITPVAKTWLKLKEMLRVINKKRASKPKGVKK
jgi:hypothetical protein